MRSVPLACVSLVLALLACEPGDSAAPADTAAAAPDPSADRARLLGALGLALDGEGRVENGCGERVVPRVVAAELGGSVGTAQLVAIDGGPQQPTCYGDGPDLHLLLWDGATYREIYAARGRMLVVLPTSRSGVRDLADGGPGFSFPVWEWDGTRYAPAQRSVADAELGGATFLP